MKPLYVVTKSDLRKPNKINMLKIPRALQLKSVAPKPAALALSGSLCEIEILGCQPDPKISLCILIRSPTDLHVY